MPNNALLPEKKRRFKQKNLAEKMCLLYGLVGFDQFMVDIFRS
jgi:hypothetical protein